MAEFAAVGHSILEDPEFVALTKEQKIVWLTLIIGRAGGKCGIFQPALQIITAQASVEVADIEAALIEFEKLGWIERDGKYIWIRSRIKYRSHSPDWFRSALTETRELLSKTVLAQRCLDTYPEPSRGLAGGPPRDTPGLPPGSKHSKAQQSKDTTPSRGARSARGSAKASKLPEPTAAAMELAAQMEADVLRLESEGHAVGEGWRRRPEQMARSLDTSGVALDVARDAWAWGLKDAFWQAEILKQMSFQKQPNRWCELVNKYLARRNAPAFDFSGARGTSTMLDHAEVAE
jgi:hypothetical protein